MLKTKFIEWYFNTFTQTTLYKSMSSTVESSPYHRENNVAIHTDMVISHYISCTSDQWSNEDLIGAIACAFHDVGKPLSQEFVTQPDGSIRKKYKGHEIISARLWENYAISNMELIESIFNFDIIDVFYIGWIIQYHLPYNIKKDYKLNRLISTLSHNNYALKDVFKTVLYSDAKGRIADDYNGNINRVLVWIKDFHHKSYDHISYTNEKICTLLIGPSGAGKTTLAEKLSNELDDCYIYSFDSIRLNKYSSDYKEAFVKSTEDKEFKGYCSALLSKVLKQYNNIVVDNTNLSDKTRHQIITQAKYNNFSIHGIVFMNSLEMIEMNQNTRIDKYIDKKVYSSQYMRLAYPSISDYNKLELMYEGKKYTIVE